MKTEIIINAAPEEVRVALIENKMVTEIYFDRKKERGIIGNVYKGKVVKVLPGMQAAFIDIGTEKASFLYVADIMTKKEVEDPENGTLEEDDDVGLDLDAEEDAEPELAEPIPVRSRSKKRPNKGIEELLKEGQDIIVQVTKEPIGTKGPRVTTYVSLPGRYLVYMPMVNHVGVSRRIEQEDERQRLKEMIRRLRKKGCGYIVRTVSDGTTEDEFKQDIDFLEVVWQGILEKNAKLKAPSLLHNDLDLIFRTVRDLFTKEVDQLVIDSRPDYDRIKDFVGTYLPDFLTRLKLWEKDEPVFDAYGVEVEISKARNRRVWLKSGGYIVIDRAEALTVIDVNTGRFVGKRDLEETIFKTNLEAVKEIAYQVRFRNIGGIIIIDLIDMEKERNRDKVMQSLNESLSNDKARTHALKISDLGLVQISRERTREDIIRTLCEPCLYCDGKGYTKSPVTMCHELFREIRLIGASPRDKKIIIGVHPSVAALLYDEARSDIEALEKQYRKKIIIKADSNLHLEQFDIVSL
ncbi:MAG: ribonuclease E/G [Nitrospiria bacterium]